MNLVVSHDQQLAVMDGTVTLKAVVPSRPLHIRSGPCSGCALSPSDWGHICAVYATHASPTCCGRGDRKDGRTIVWQRI